MKDLLISKLREMVKVKKPKAKKTEPTEADRADFAAWQDRKEAEREPSDIEDERNQMAKHYGQQSEAIDFSKKTIAGKAARKTAAGALKAVKSRFQQAGLAKKPGDAAKLTKQYSQETYKQRESTNLKDRMVAVLLETFLGTSRDYVARAMSREGKGSSMKDRSRKGKALASVINAQPGVEKARAERDAANATQNAANTARRGSNGRSSDSATHWRNNWPSGSWGSA